jgi:uncharacterized membrane-anchored protein
MKKFAHLLFVMSALFFTVPVFAKEPQYPKINWQAGPKTIKVASGLAELNLPKGYLFADESDAKKLLKVIGNNNNEQVVGLVLPNNREKEWFVVFEYDPMGYVKDDEAKTIDAKKLLQQIKEGTAEGNKHRAEQGIGPIEIIGWQEEPHYDEQTHNLVWSIIAKDSKSQFVNYNTKVLGRYGVTSITLVSDLQSMAAIRTCLKIKFKQVDLT